MEQWILTLTDEDVGVLADALLLAATLRATQARDATDPDRRRDYGWEGERLRRFHEERLIPLRELVFQARLAG